MSILVKMFTTSKTIFPKGTIFYRSRIYNLSDSTIKKLGYFEQKQYEGFDEKGSFVNLEAEWPMNGRMNPNGIRVLYVSSDIKTSVREINPSFDELISVAEIECQEDLKIADISNIDIEKDDIDLLNYHLYIQDLLSTGYSEKDYIFPQFIAAYCQNQGFDGIGYRSKFSRKSDKKQKNGINYTIFNYDKCKAISSKLHIVRNTTITLKEMEALLPEGFWEKLEKE